MLYLVTAITNISSCSNATTSTFEMLGYNCKICARKLPVNTKIKEISFDKYLTETMTGLKYEESLLFDVGTVGSAGRIC